MLYNITRVIFNAVYFSFFRLKIIGLENIPKDGAVVIASNHISLLDPPTIGTACRYRKIAFMAKQELFDIFIFGNIIRRFGAFPVKRGTSDRNAIKTALEILKNKDVLGIFPEGTRSKDGKLGKAGPTVVMLASRTNAVIVPTAVIGTNKISFSNPFPKITVAFGKRIILPKNQEDKGFLEEYTKIMMKEIETLLITNKKD